MEDAGMVSKIFCAAIYYDDGIKYVHQPKNITSGFVICGRRHHNCFMTAYILNKQKKLLDMNEKQGFLTSDDRFVDRYEAAEIAFDAGQISEKTNILISEDLY
jgi:hypothetical protein